MGVGERPISRELGIGNVAWSGEALLAICLWRFLMEETVLRHEIIKRHIWDKWDGMLDQERVVHGEAIPKKFNLEEISSLWLGFFSSSSHFPHTAYQFKNVVVNRVNEAKSNYPVPLLVISLCSKHEGISD